MQRADILRDLAAADLLVLAGHPVPPELLPPARGDKVMKAFAYRARIDTGGFQLCVLAGPLGWRLPEAAREGDRVSARADGAPWQPVSPGVVAECPDFI